jgi:hypothetical protein
VVEYGQLNREYILEKSSIWFLRALPAKNNEFLNNFLVTESIIKAL